MENLPEFFRKNFSMPCNLWCEKEEVVSEHTLEYVAKTDNHVSYYKTCAACKTQYDKLLGLGVDLGNPRKADVMLLQEYVFLVLHPSDVILAG